MKDIVIIGAGKNGMELYQVIKDDLSYGFNVLGFFDDNSEIIGKKSVLINVLIFEMFCWYKGFSENTKNKTIKK